MIYGFGVNDATYSVQPRCGGVKVHCPFYTTWVNMLMRSYSKAFHSKNPTYVGCTVSDEWKYFSNFKAWMEKQDWEGKELDKDILVAGNKQYSPDTCVFVDKLTNNFFRNWQSISGEFTRGVHRNPKTGKYHPQFRKTIKSKSRFLGSFDTEELAKHECEKAVSSFASELVCLQNDKRVVDVLNSIILNKVVN